MVSASIAFRAYQSIELYSSALLVNLCFHLKYQCTDKVQLVQGPNLQKRSAQRTLTGIRWITESSVSSRHDRKITYSYANLKLHRSSHQAMYSRWRILISNDRVDRHPRSRQCASLLVRSYVSVVPVNVSRHDICTVRKTS
jgi:hypothetical protein